MAGSPLRLLVLGGTRFVGRALVEAALASGHRVTIFNRGLTNPALFPDVERLRGDRSSSLSALDGRSWDVTLDVAAYHPDDVRRSIERLRARGRYAMISTLSVYADQSRPHGEDWPVLKLSSDTRPSDLYGARKAACEQLVLETFRERALIIRAGLIAGPWDPTDRVTYWPRRLARSGVVLAPGNPDDPLQFVDVRDLAAWTVRMIGQPNLGVFNVTGDQLPFGAFLEACREVTNSDAEVVWARSEALLALNVDPWMGVPLWIAAPGWAGANRVSIERARLAGLTTRTATETVRDAWQWDQTRRAQGQGPPEALSPQRERQLLQELGVGPGVETNPRHDTESC